MKTISRVENNIIQAFRKKVGQKPIRTCSGMHGGESDHELSKRALAATIMVALESVRRSARLSYLKKDIMALEEDRR